MHTFFFDIALRAFLKIMWVMVKLAKSYIVIDRDAIN